MSDRIIKHSSGVLDLNESIMRYCYLHSSSENQVLKDLRKDTLKDIKSH